MGIGALFVLAIASSAAFGALGVLLGLRLGVRTLQRDEERYAPLVRLVESFKAQLSSMKIEWGSTLEQIEQLATQVEKRRRQAAASEAHVNRREEAEAAAAVQAEAALTPRQRRDAVRLRMRGRG